MGNADMRGGDYAPTPAAPPVARAKAMPEPAAQQERRKADEPEAQTTATEDTPQVDKSQVRIRSWFPETMFWSPNVITDAEGKATVSMQVADSITTWRVAATASAADGRIGAGQGALKVFQDFFVDIDLPVALTVGDEVQIPIAVHNYLQEPQKVRLEVEEGAWFEALTPRVSEVTLLPNEVRGVPLRLKAKSFGRQTLTVFALGSKLQDAVRRQVEVRPDGVLAENAVGGVLTDGMRLTGEIPAGAIAGTERAFLRVYPGLLSAALDGIEGTLKQPYGCFEQTSSATYPNVLVLDYLRKSGRSKPDVEAKALEYIQQGYQRLLSFEVQGGGFEWFGRAPANQVLTAYGLLEFADMARVYEVDPQVIRRTQEWLISKQGSDGSWTPDASSLRDGLYRDEFSGKVATTAYIAWALIESGYRGPAADRAVSYLLSNAAEEKSGYTLSLVASALIGSGRTMAASPILERIEGLAVRTDTTTYLPAGTRTATYSAGGSANVETTALASLALARTGRASRVPGTLDWLLAQRLPHGAWSSTQATVLALRTLLSSPGDGADPEANAEVGVSLGGQTLETLRFTPESSDIVRTVELTRYAKAGEPLEVSLAKIGRTRAQVQLVTRAYVPRPPPQQALVLALGYDRVSLAPDDTVTARVTARWNNEGPSGMVMLALGVPPGFEVDGASVTELVAAGKVGKFSMTGRELLLYVDSLSSGEPLELSYKLRARYPVKAKAPPSLAYLYYQPEVRAESGSIDMIVR